MTAPPPSLRELFGNRYQIGHDPAAETYAERNDPWMQTLPCRNGLIYPQGADRLAVECKSAIAARLRKLPGIDVHQQGSTEWTLLFDLAMFDAVAAIVKPKRRRKWSDDKRQAMARHLFGAKEHVPTVGKVLKAAFGTSKWPDEPLPMKRSQKNARAACSGIPRKSSPARKKPTGEAKVNPA